ncbi:MAG TPA: hypothetical protein IAC14_05035 [Candidatus Scybalomonas excrementigallinarum]|nr:hypothetical protein [Candidatus Scybalomonas excrementigallinarum]
MKSKIKIGLVLLLGLFLFPLGYMNNVQAAESKEVLINQINTVENETLTFNATTGGRLEVVVPLSCVSQNGDWDLYISGEKSGDSGDDIYLFRSHDLMKDTVIYRAYIEPGKYELSFYGGKAVCQINFIVDAIHDEIENNDSFETANPLIINTDKNGQLVVGESDCFKLELSEKGLVQFEFKKTSEKGSYTYEIYEEDSNGNLSLFDSGWEDSKSRRFFGSARRYYIRLMQKYSYDTDYTIRANFVSVENTFCEIEDNDIYTLATPITGNVDYSGNLESGYDIDWYHITLSEDKLSQAILKTERQMDNEVFDVTLYINKNGELKEIENVKSGINNVTHTTNKKYLEAGDYYIKVKHLPRLNDVGNTDQVKLSEQDYYIQLSEQEILLPQPQITVQQETFPNITITSSEFGEFESGMEVYEKVGNGDWKLSQISYENECSTAVSKLGEKCSYRVRTYYKDEESGVTVYSDYSNEESITLPKLKQPTLSAKRSNFSEVTLSFSNIDSRAESIIIYQKVGNSNWKQVKTVSSKVKSSKIAIKTLGKKYSYQIKSEADFFYSNASKVKSITISSKLEKPTFTVTKKKYYGTLAFYIKPTKYNYAQGVEIWSGDAKGYWDYKSKLNLSKSKGTYFYNLEKGRSYYIKMRSYRKVNGKTIYSPWTAVKKVVR